eukprot:Nitzschia sp. Nitz4//scaffold38_size140716//113604//114257//NITZ4_003164-RA/size140716-processed-gene-0.65-mRNA-1//-1//CDS//3329550129//8230//frame0
MVDALPKKEQSTLWENLLSKVGSTTSTVVSGTFFFVLAYRRDAPTVSFFMGAIGNGILSKVLKKIVDQQRPPELSVSKLDLPPSDNGMPSSHAMSMGFIFTYTALSAPWTTMPLIGYLLVSLKYRVKMHLHTVDQILVGLALGTANGFVWRALCFGKNPMGIHVLDWVSKTILRDQEKLPWWGLAVPALVGAAVVGSVERRISRWVRSLQSKGDKSK